MVPFPSWKCHYLQGLRKWTEYGWRSTYLSNISDNRLRVQIICVAVTHKSTLRFMYDISITMDLPSIMHGNVCMSSVFCSNFREIPFFKDLRKIRLLSAQPLMDEELKQQLKSRGTDFVKLKGTHYLEYHDSVYQRRNFGLESRILKFRVPTPQIP